MIHFARRRMGDTGLGSAGAPPAVTVPAAPSETDPRTGGASQAPGAISTGLPSWPRIIDTAVFGRSTEGGASGVVGNREGSEGSAGRERGVGGAEVGGVWGGDVLRTGGSWCQEGASWGLAGGAAA